MLNLFKKDKTIENLERMYEARLSAQQSIFQEQLDAVNAELDLAKRQLHLAEEELKLQLQVNAASLANEVLLNRQTAYLSRELHKVKNNPLVKS
jgi:hypothetical protein